MPVRKVIRHGSPEDGGGQEFQSREEEGLEAMRKILFQTSRDFIVLMLGATAWMGLCAGALVLIHYISGSPTERPVMPLSNPVLMSMDKEIDVILQPGEKVRAQNPRPSLESAAITDQEQEISEWKTVRMKVTAYCPCSLCCGDSSDGITASGHVIESGDCFAAADAGMPFGTELIIPGYNGDNPVKVMDRGSAIYGEKLDIFFTTHWRAKQWGVRYLEVKVKMPVLSAKAD